MNDAPLETFLKKSVQSFFGVTIEIQITVCHHQPMYVSGSLFSNQSVKPAVLMKRVASIGGSVSPMTLCGKACASTEALPRDPKMRLINVVFLRTLSEIKLKRTDTTLDLSQKAKRAEKRKKKSIKRRGVEGIFIPNCGGPCGASDIRSLVLVCLRLIGRYGLPQLLHICFAMACLTIRTSKS